MCFPVSSIEISVKFQKEKKKKGKLVQCFIHLLVFHNSPFYRKEAYIYLYIGTINSNKNVITITSNKNVNFFSCQL